MKTEERKWPSKRTPVGFCGGVFPHVYAPPNALREPGLCIFCGTPETEAKAAGDRGRRAPWDEPRKTP